MPLFPEFQSFESLALPVVVLRSERVAYVNPAWERLLGRRANEVVGLAEMDMARVAVAASDLELVDELRRNWDPNGPVASVFWVRIPTVHGERLMHAIPSRGPREGDMTFQFVDASAEADARAFTDSLIEGAARLFVCREEEQVWDIAVETLASQGLSCVAYLLDADGAHLRFGPARQPERMRASFVQFMGPLNELRIPLEATRSVRRMFEQGRAVFHQDLCSAMEGFAPKAMLEALRPNFPRVRGAAAPVFVDETPRGLLSVLSPELSPLLVATMEMFARQVGNALENVRHHQVAADRLRQVQALQHELVSRERLAVLGEAAAMLAHEVRNPLGTIVNTAALIRRQGPRGVDPTVAQMLEEEALRLDQLVHALLDFTRPIRCRPSQTFLGELVQEAVSVAQRQAAPGGVTVLLELPPSPSVLYTDASLLQIALGNLVRNAIQATAPGGAVRVSLAPAERGVCFRVSDDGPGVPSGDHERIFEPFFTTRAVGTGLGLPVVKRVAEVLGGSVALEPSAGRGACFRLFVPDGVAAQGA